MVVEGITPAHALGRRSIRMHVGHVRRPFPAVARSSARPRHVVADGRTTRVVSRQILRKVDTRAGLSTGNVQDLYPRDQFVECDRTVIVLGPMPRSSRSSRSRREDGAPNSCWLPCTNPLW